MPVTSTRRFSSTSTPSSGLSPFIGGSSAATSSDSYRRLSPSRYSTTSRSTTGSTSGYYRSLNTSSNYSSNSSYRNSYAGTGGSGSSGGLLGLGSRVSLDRDHHHLLSSSTSPIISRTNRSESRHRGVPLTNNNNNSCNNNNANSLTSSSEDHNHNQTYSRSSSSTLRSKPPLSATTIAAISNAELYEKYSPAHYIPKCDLSRSRSLSDAAASSSSAKTNGTNGTAGLGITDDLDEVLAEKSRRTQRKKDCNSEDSGALYDRLNNNNVNSDGSSSSGKLKSLRTSGSSSSVGGAALGGGTITKVTEPAHDLAQKLPSGRSNSGRIAIKAINHNHTSINTNNNTINSSKLCDKHNNPSISSTRNHITKIQIKSAATTDHNLLQNRSCTSQNKAIVCVFDNNSVSPGSINQNKPDPPPAKINRIKLPVNDSSSMLKAGNPNLKSNYSTNKYGEEVNSRRKADDFLKQECELTRNELMQRKIAENYNGGPLINSTNPNEPRLTKEEINNNKIVIEVTKGPLEINNNSSQIKVNSDRSLKPISTAPSMAYLKSNGVHNGYEYKNELEQVRSAILKGNKQLNHRGVENGDRMDMEEDEDVSRKQSKPITNGKSANSSVSSSSSSSLMDTSDPNQGVNGKGLEDDIKFIDSDDNNETQATSNGIGSSYSNKLSKLNKNVSSTIDSLMTSTPIVSALKNITHQQGHHTLPHNSAPNYAEYSKKYSTLSNLPSRIRNGIMNGLDDRNSYSQKSYSNESLQVHDKLKENLSALIATSEPPNDKISGKSWELSNGGSVRTSSLRNALPPVSPVKLDGSRYRSLLDSEPIPSTSSAGTYSKSSILSDPYEKATADSSEGLCGLRNIGNTCFMNSVIQCLSHTNDLTKFLKSQRDPKSTTKDQRIFSEFVKLIKDMWSGTTRSVTPMDLKSAFSSKHRMYSGCGQQDAQEFLRFFLDALHSACNDGTKQEGLTLDDNMSDSKKADLMWDWYSKTENSKIKDLFVGQLRSTLKCTVCGNTSVTFDPFWDLSVPLPSSSRCKLENCLESFIKEEILEGDEMPTCSKCQKRQKSTKSFTIQRFPKYLVVHLKRFSETRWSKMTNVVEFPTGDRELNLAPYASNNNSSIPNYSLYAISNHMGSTAGGHYVALCKHPQSKKWHEFNDNLVSDICESSLVSASAYLLFYERA